MGKTTKKLTEGQVITDADYKKLEDQVKLASQALDLYREGVLDTLSSMEANLDAACRKLHSIKLVQESEAITKGIYSPDVVKVDSIQVEGLTATIINFCASAVNTDAAHVSQMIAESNANNPKHPKLNK